MNFIYICHGNYGCYCECCGTEFCFAQGDEKNFNQNDVIKSKFEFLHFDQSEKDIERAIEKAKVIARDFQWDYEKIIIGDLLGPHKEHESTAS